MSTLGREGEESSNLFRFYVYESQVSWLKHFLRRRDLMNGRMGLAFRDELWTCSSGEVMGLADFLPL